MLLSRNSTGQILDGQTAVTFSGGFLRPFRDDKTPEYALARADDTLINLQFPADSVCTDTDPQKQDRRRRTGCDCDALTDAKRLYWDWPTAFIRLKNRGINLVRVFGMNGIEFRQRNAGPIDVYPFLRDTTTGRFRVQDAVTAGMFNRDYFDLFLKPFVQAADQNGVAVQFCLFSYHDLTNTDTDFFKYFPASPWNPKATTPEAWGETNLVPSSVGSSPIERNFYFTSSDKAITAAQNWWVGCVVQTLRGMGNVILELFNEPRSLYTDTHDVVHDHRVELAKWYDWLVGRILYWAGSWRPLLSVNASQLEGTTWDIDTWKANHPLSFNAMDLVSYHGLTGFPPLRYAPCGGGAGDYAPVDPKHIADRVTAHRGAYGLQAAILSTDSVKNPTHVFNDQERPQAGVLPAAQLELDKRDGQLQTTTPLPGGSSVENLLEYSDLTDWATWSLAEANKPANVGKVHFQNHSIFRASFDLIGAARVAAKSMGSVVAPAFTGADWSQFSALSDPHAGRNFQWAQRHLVPEGGSVTQLGTVAAPQDPRWEMTVETGWRCNFSPSASGWCCFLIAYTPVSVSIRSAGALVTPMVVARLHEAGAGGALGATVSHNDALVGPAAAAGTLVVCGDVMAGKTYALVVTGAVTVNYRNRYQGYGEVIVHFPSIRRLVP